MPTWVYSVPMHAQLTGRPAYVIAGCPPPHSAHNTSWLCALACSPTFWQSIGSPQWVCAPMVWQSERAFRMLVRELGGVGLCYTPMINAHVLVGEEQPRSPDAYDSLDAVLHDLTARRADVVSTRDTPTIAQFCATTPSAFVRAAKLVEPYVDAVDLNLGCPQAFARRHGFGAFLVDTPAVVEEMIRRCVEAVGVPVTAKIRVFGTVAATVAFAQMLEAAGCSAVAVHGRTRDQRHHEGTVDVDAIAAVVAALGIPVIANGGVGTLQEAAALKQRTGAAAVMAATGLLRNAGMFAGLERDPWRDCRAYMQYAAAAPPPCVRFEKDHILAFFDGIRTRGGSFKQHPDIYDLLARNAAITTHRQLLEILRLFAHRVGVPWEPLAAPHSRHTQCTRAEGAASGSQRTRAEDSAVGADSSPCALPCSIKQIVDGDFGDVGAAHLPVIRGSSDCNGTTQVGVGGAPVAVQRVQLEAATWAYPGNTAVRSHHDHLCTPTHPHRVSPAYHHHTLHQQTPAHSDASATSEPEPGQDAASLRGGHDPSIRRSAFRIECDVGCSGIRVRDGKNKTVVVSKVRSGSMAHEIGVRASTLCDAPFATAHQEPCTRNPAL